MLEENTDTDEIFFFLILKKIQHPVSCIFFKYGCNGQFSGTQKIETNRKLNRLITLEENKNETKKLVQTKELDPDYSISECFNYFQNR